VIIIQSLSASSIYHDPQHPPCSNYVLGNLFARPFSMSSLVYFLVWSPPPHIPYISTPNQCLLFAAHAHGHGSKILLNILQVRCSSWCPTNSVCQHTEGIVDVLLMPYLSVMKMSFSWWNAVCLFTYLLIAKHLNGSRWCFVPELPQRTSACIRWVSWSAHGNENHPRGGVLDLKNFSGLAYLDFQIRLSQ